MKINKDIVYGFVAVVLVSGFAYSVGDIFSENSEKQLSEIRKVQKSQEEEKLHAQLREQTANMKRDSALSVLNRQNKGVNMLNKNFSNLNLNVMNLKSLYDKNLNNLKNIPNEKDHVIDASADQQFDFITKFKYREYTGIANP